ncbi:Ldh family oxidoreductase [Devosia honganensis]|uniref:Ldh family oxidoreductase n=1 Tax=Devosia honganensis TaxID=1610527 RepID=A0ABV7WX79_9HYPH
MSFPGPSLIDFAARALTQTGTDGDAARVVAELLVEADLLGHGTHGIDLLASYVAELERGTMLGTGEPDILRDHGAIAHWDGRWLSGVRLIAQAIDTALEKASRYGLGAVSIRRAHHTACLQAYLERATQRGMMVIIASSDPRSATVAPFGGLDPVLGPDPLALGIPTHGDPILIDMSSSITTNGMVARIAATGGLLPGPWLQDNAGRPSADPKVLSASPPGSMLLAGGQDHGHKGFGMALAVEALSQGLSGHGRANAEPRWSASVFVQVIDPAAFSGLDDFADQAEALVRLCHGARPHPDFTAVRLPGERALARKRHALQHGIVLHAYTLTKLTELSRRLGLSLPQPLAR